MIFQNSLMDYK